MVRNLLLLLFFVMFMGTSLGLNVSLAPGVSVKNLFLYVIFTWIAIEVAVLRDRKVECLSVIAPFGLLLVYAVFSWLVVVLFVDYPGYRPIGNAIALKSQMADSLFMLLVFFFGVKTEEDGIWLFKMVVWIVFVGNALTLADAFHMPDLPMLSWHHEGRLNSFLGQPNEFGVFLVFFLPATVALFVVETGIKRFLAGIGVMLGFVCLVLTFSRGSYVGILLGSLFGAVYLRKFVSPIVAVRIGTAMFAIGVIAIPLLFAAGFDGVFRARFSLFGGNTDTLTTGRSTLWLRALSVMAEQPVSFLTGYGWNAYESFKEFRLSVHNTYLNYLFNLGAIGLTLFLMTISAVLVTLRRGLSVATGVRKPF